MPEHILALLVGALLDIILGDPEWFPHPVRLIGRFIGFAERLARRGDPPARALRRRAVALGLSTVLVTALVTALILWLLRLWGRWPHFIGMVLISWTCLSARNLAQEAEGVGRALSQGLEAGRARVSRIVGRDTANLTRREVLYAAIETVAENTTDGVISPMLYLALGGPVLGMAFKAVNTLDSMVGYRNARYEHLGWFSARMDDAWNYVPARITALLMCVSAALLGMDGRRAFATVRRDHKNHLSPNCAWSEAAAAGALGVRLGGTHSYFGQTVVKPTIGDDIRLPETRDIRRVNLLMFASSGLMLGLIAAAAALI